MAWVAYRWWLTLWQAGTIDGKLKALKLTFSSIVQVGHWMPWLRYQKADALKQPQATLPFANHTSTQKTLHKFIGVLTQLHIVNQHAVKMLQGSKVQELNRMIAKWDCVDLHVCMCSWLSSCTVSCISSWVSWCFLACHIVPRIADASPYMRSLLKGLDGKEEENEDSGRRDTLAAAWHKLHFTWCQIS